MNDTGPSLASAPAPDAPPKFSHLSQMIMDMREVTNRLERLRDNIAGPTPSEVPLDDLPLDTLATMLSNGPQVLLYVRGEQIKLLDEIEHLLL